MAARKLQTEVDKTFKRITEGVEVFESIYDKMQAASNQAQKEKLENDLKTQIKKLQRMRDQIKVWLQSNDIKDKQQLTDYRKLIETQMERFKACEKEMKTKAFSRAGLDAAAKLDPKELAKRDMGDWVTTMTDDLGRQIEHAEAEVEGLQGGLSKKKKDNKAATRTAELEAANDRRKWHISRLEIVLRMLENGTLDVEQLNDSSFKDDVKYYVESNTEEDFEEDEGIYDDLNLDEEEEAFGMGQEDVVSSHDSTSVADTSDFVPHKTPAKDSPGGPKRSASISLTADESPMVKKPGRKPTLDSTTVRPVVIPPPAAKTPATTSAGPSPAAAKPQTAPLRYASAAAGALAPQATPASAPQSSPAVTTQPSSAPSPPMAAATPVSATSTAAPIPVPAASSAPAAKDIKVAPSATAVSASQPPPLSSSPTNVMSPPSVAATVPSLPPGLGGASPPTIAAAIASQPSAQTPSSAGLPTPPPVQPQEKSTPAPIIAAVPPAAPTLTTQIPRPTSTQPSESSSATKAPPPSSLADLVTTFESAKGKALRKDADLGAIHQILESGYSNVPQAQDADKPKYYVPRQPYQTPANYPQTPMSHLETPALFNKLDLDTLFYVFYYFQGTYMQYLAAQELKKQSWRYHRQYLTWFQRASEPVHITEEYEEGGYLYFDWDVAWSTRRKNSFKFHYVHLE